MITLSFIFTLIVGAIFSVCCLLLLGVMFMLVARPPEQESNAPDIWSKAIFTGFGLLIGAIAYWSGSWLFRSDDEATAPRQEITEEYPGGWRSDAPGNIIQTLIANNARGCGEFHYKPSAWNSGEYLVYCTADGKNWAAYLVWPNVDRISGPARPDPSISPPH